MATFRFDVRYVDHDGFENRKVVSVEEDDGDLECAQMLAESKVCMIPAERNPTSSDPASIIQIVSIEQREDND